MVVRFAVLAFAVAVCYAAPYNIIAKNYSPGAIFRNNLTPSIAYGFGSGFSSNVAGIKHSTGISHSFRSGGGQAYGGGFASNDGASYARGIGIANTNSNPYYRAYNIQPRYQAAIPYNTGLSNYRSAVSSAQNFGNFGTTVAQANAVGFGSAVSSAINLRNIGYRSAITSATTNGYGSAVSTANSGYGSAVSSAQTSGLGEYSSAISASENVGGVRASTAQTFQQRGGALQQSIATSYDGPGIQAAHSNSINTGYY